MKKNFLLLFLMCILMGGVSSLFAQEVTIGEGTGGTSNGQYVPIYIGNSNTYAFSQQIYFANEINMPNGGTINQISFYTYNNKWTRKIEIYLTHTEKTTFSTNNAWEPVSENNKVFTGEVEFGSGNANDIVWVTITLDKGFQYDGTKNLLVCVNDLTGTKTLDSNYPKFRTNTVAKTNTVIYKYGTQITDPSTQLSSLNANARKAYRNIIKLNFGGAAEKKDPVFTDTYAYPNGQYATNIFNPSLSFYAENKTHYKVLLSTTSDFSSDVRYVTGSETEWVYDETKQIYTSTVTGLNYSQATTYYWKVIASNGGGADDPTAESTVYSFTTKQISAPGQIEYAYPNGEQGLVNPELTWTFGSDTEEYQVIIDGEAKTEWTNPGSSTTGSYQTSGLSAGEHTWRIDAKNSVATTTGTEYSFSIASLPDNVTPISPANGATGVTSNIVRFQFAEGTTEYRLLYSNTTTAEMGYIRVDQGGTGSTWTSTGGATEMEFTIPGFGLGKTLYWAVDVKNAIGNRAVYYGDEEAAIYSFTAASTLPVANDAPENGTNNLENPELSWNFIGNATHYMVYLGTEENNLTPATEWLARGTEGTGLVGSGSYQTTDLAAATQYFWRVDVKEGVEGEVLAGDVWSFVTELEAPVAQANPAQVVPSYGIVYGGTTIQWNKIETAQGYNVYLDGVKLNDELIKTNVNYYEVPANSMKLKYNMDPGYNFQVEAEYGNGLGSVMSEDVIVKVTGTGYLSAYIEDENNAPLEDAIITLTCTKDEFGNEYEEGKGRQYVLRTNSNGEYSSSTEGNERIQNGTYNVKVTKTDYKPYQQNDIKFNNNESTNLNISLTSKYKFEVTITDVNFYSVKINLGTDEYGDYHVYLKNGNSPETYLGQKGFSPNQDNETVSCKYDGWANLGKGNYLFGVSKIKDEKINWTEAVEIRNYDIFYKEGDWNTPSCWIDDVPSNTKANVYILAPATIAATDEITVGTVNIETGGSLTINGSLKADKVYNNAAAGALCINDGAQVKLNNDNVAATFNMNIVNQSPIEGKEGVPGWQFISSPFTNASVSAFTTADKYDLYKYNGGKAGGEWDNHKTETGIDANFETEFVNGRGYLASYETETTATLSGTLNAEKTFDRTYSYTAGDENKLKNFFLVGNPFPFNMDLSKFNLNNVYNGFATVDPETGAYIKHTKEEDNIIPVGDGFFVEAIGADPSISYNVGSKSRGEKYEYINVVASGKQGSNNVIIKLSGAEERGFSKLENLNQSIADLYVKNNGRQYSILGYDRDVQEIELFFDAKEMGNYTIGIEPNGKFQSVTLVDRMTGIETNMLLDSYTFTATANDNPNRFLIRLANGQQPTANSQFVYQSGEELIINAEGTIQIIDMMGRMIYSSNAENSRINVSNLKGATYIVRNITDNDVKVQKVVIY